MEFFFKTTFGKLIFKLKIHYIGNNIFFVSILIRTISRLIPFDVFFLLLNNENLLLHDKLSKTIVVNNKNDIN